MSHPQSFVIEAEEEKGIDVALTWIQKELGMQGENNPDIIVLRYGLFSVIDARKVIDLASGGSFSGTTKVIIVSARRAYHEAQNALLKLFEEPPQGTHLFLVLPTLGSLLSTLRSRVQLLTVGPRRSYSAKSAEEFMKASMEKRSTLIKKLSSGKDDEERREHRDEAIALVNGIEALAYAKHSLGGETAKLLADIAVLRGYLYDRSAPVRMILEHIVLVLPKEIEK
jgi:DNA polymerase III delta prime subunit